jgi:hypothetical protein
MALKQFRSMAYSTYKTKSDNLVSLSLEAHFPFPPDFKVIIQHDSMVIQHKIPVIGISFQYEEKLID